MRIRYLTDYLSAIEVKAHFFEDIHSRSGQTLAADMSGLKLTRFEDVRAEFLDLCTRLGLMQCP
jgi:hypothetical protein